MPSAPLHLVLWGLCRSWGLPPISCIRPRTKGVCSCSGDAPPLLLCRVSSPTPPTPAWRALAVHTVRGMPPLRSPGQPPPTSLACMPWAWSARCSGGTPLVSSGFGAPPTPLPCMPCAGSTHWLLGAHTLRPCLGAPLPPSPACHALIAHAAVWGGPPLPLSSGCVWRLRVEAVCGGCARRLRAEAARRGCVQPARGAPPYLLPTRVLHTLLGQGGPLLLLFLALQRVPTLTCLGTPPRSLAACRGSALLGGGSPPLSPPWRPQMLSARNRSEIPLPSFLAPRMPHTGSVRCRVLSPSSVALPSCLACSPVVSWPSVLTRSPPLAGSTAVPVGGSKPYSRRTSAPCAGLAPSVPAVCMVRVPVLLLSTALPRYGPPCPAMGVAALPS